MLNSRTAIGILHLVARAFAAAQGFHKAGYQRSFSLFRTSPAKNFFIVQFLNNCSKFFVILA